jgi:hypothetical protein
MIQTKENMELMQGQHTSSWIHEVLEPDQLSSAKNLQHVARRQLKPGTVIVLWALRFYVVLMMLIIAYQIWSVVQS